MTPEGIASGAVLFCETVVVQYKTESACVYFFLTNFSCRRHCNLGITFTLFIFKRI